MKVMLVIIVLKRCQDRSSTEIAVDLCAVEIFHFHTLQVLICIEVFAHFVPYSTMQASQKGFGGMRLLFGPTFKV